MGEGRRCGVMEETPTQRRNDCSGSKGLSKSSEVDDGQKKLFCVSSAVSRLKSHLFLLSCGEIALDSCL